jgi:Rieske Fe-S protein
MPLIPRRRFVKGLFLGTAFSSILGKSWSSAYAAMFSPAAAADDATFQININDYPALQGELGSVRVGVSPVGPDHFPASRYYPVIINRDPDSFYVLSSECKHASCVIPTFNTSDFGMRCPCHGSLYDIRGDVVEGPAAFSLNSYEFSFDGTSMLTIVVPEMSFQVQAFVPNSPEAARVQLQFVAEGAVNYEVRFREKLTDPWASVPFATTPQGPANQDVLLGNGELNTLYLDRTTPTGFYAVSMFLDEV